jgi:hypothetical protein
MSLLRLGAVAIAISFFGAGAFAQGTPQQRAACRPDVTKFCKGKGEDPGVILECLESNKDKISERCRKVIAEGDEKPSPASAQKKDTPAEPAASGEKKEEKK